MAYLRLSDPTTDSCDFKVKLSNPFNTDYYKGLKITKNNYGSSTSSVSSYLERRTASNSSSVYVRGVVNKGLSAGRTYTLYAYAQAANGTWYLAGSDDITMEDNESKEIDLGIKKIYYKYEDSNDSYELAEDDTVFETGRKIKFKVEVKNYTDVREPDYTVSVYDEDGNRLARDTGETPASKYKINNAYLYGIKRNSSGKQKLKFAIILEDSRWTDTDEKDNIRYRTFKWAEKSTGPSIKLEKGKFNLSLRNAQEFLIKLGYDLGTAGADGLWGNKTKEALNGFEIKNNLSQSTDEKLYKSTYNLLEAKAGITTSEFWKERRNKWIFPLRGTCTDNPLTGARRFASNRSNGARSHAGQDLYAEIGREVLACTNGEVVSADSYYDGTYQITVKNDDGTYIRYGEVQKPTVKIGTSVRKGQVIGKVGDLLSLSYQMLHFEVYLGDLPGVPPENMVDGPYNNLSKEYQNKTFKRRRDLLNPSGVIYLDIIE